jgi:hypothetical protein
MCLVGPDRCPYEQPMAQGQPVANSPTRLRPVRATEHAAPSTGPLNSAMISEGGVYGGIFAHGNIRALKIITSAIGTSAGKSARASKRAEHVREMLRLAIAEQLTSTVLKPNAG